MGHGIDAGQGRYATRLCDSQLGIQQRDAAGGSLVAAGHLGMGRRIGDERERLRLASRTRRGGNGDHRQHRAGCLAHAPVILHAAAAGKDEVDSLRAVHRAAAPQPNEQVGGELPRDLDPGVDILGRGVFVNLIEQLGRDAGPPERVYRMLGMSRGDNARIADDQSSAKTHLGSQAAKIVDLVGTEDDPRSRVEVKATHAAPTLYAKR